MPERAKQRLTPPGQPSPAVLGPVRGQHTPVDIEKIIVAGHRGQGVRFLGKVIAHAGLIRGLNVTWLPMFSPTIRGPSDHCTVLVSRETIGSPLAGVPDIVLAFDAPDFDLFKLRIKAGGLMLYNASAIDVLPDAFRDDIRTIGVPATEMARDLAAPRAANMVLLGAYIGSSRLLDEKSAMEALRAMLAGNDPERLLDSDRKAIEEGIRFVRERRYMHNRYAYSIFNR